MNCSVPGCKHAAWHKDSTCFRHTAPPRETIARVYAAYREMPRASLRDIGYRLHLAPSTVNRALWALDRADAIAKPPRKIARGVVIPPAAIYQDTPYTALWLDL